MRFGTIAGLPLAQTGLEDLMDTLQKGYEVGRQPQRAALEDALKRQQIDLTGAQARSERLYGGLGKFSGQPSQALGLEMLKNQYGEDSQTYKLAERAYLADIAHKEAMAEAAPWRYKSPLGRTLMEEEEIARKIKEAESKSGQGYAEDHPASIAGVPDQNDALQSELEQVENLEERERLKSALDVYRRKKEKDVIPQPLQISKVKAEMIEPTIEGIVPEEAFIYSGAEGLKNRVQDMYASSQGRAPERYIKYKQHRQRLTFLAKQYRNFLGDSVSPSVQEALDTLVRPESFWNSPEVAIAAYNTAIDILNKEMDILNKAATIYQPKTGTPRKEKTLSEMSTEELLAMKRGGAK